MLRGEESDGDREYAERLCRGLNVPIYCENADAAAYAAAHGMGTEQGARQLRYEFFERAAAALGADKIATAHTADDNLETVIFNLTRGAGLRGLCGIPPVRGNIIRPLIYCGRADVMVFNRQTGLEYRQDSSNFGRDYTRNRIRLDVIPILKGINPSAEKTVAANSDMLRSELEIIDAAADSALARASRDGGLDCAALASMPAALSGRLAARLHGQCADGRGSLSAAHIDAVLRLAKMPEGNKRLSLPGGVLAYKCAGGILKMRRVDEKTDGRQAGIAERRLNAPGITHIPEAGLDVQCEILQKKCVKDKENEKKANTFYIDCDRINGPITVRSRQIGDKIEVYPRGIAKTLKKLMNEKKIEPDERELLPVIVCDGRVAAAYRLGLNAEFAARADGRCMRIRFVRAAGAAECAGAAERVGTSECARTVECAETAECARASECARTAERDQTAGPDGEK